MENLISRKVESWIKKINNVAIINTDRRITFNLNRIKYTVAAI